MIRLNNVLYFCMLFLTGLFLLTSVTRRKYQFTYLMSTKLIINFMVADSIDIYICEHDTNFNLINEHDINSNLITNV